MDKGRTPFPVASWQIASFLQQLAWIDDERQQPSLMLWPYPARLSHLTFSWPRLWERLCHPLAGPAVWQRDYYRPGEMLDAMTWRQYRMASAWIEQYGQQPTADNRRRFLCALLDCPERLVRRLGDVEFQVVLIWWGAMMRYLQQQYPKCFSRQQPRRSQKRQPLPIEIYTRTTATMEKYLGIDEERVNRESAHNILRHLNDMAVEAEEMEKIRRKHR